MKLWIVVGTVASLAAASRADIVSMTDQTGAPLIERLFEGTGVDASSIPANRVEFVGLTTGGYQSGLFTTLELRGAQGTSQTIGPGIVLSSGRVDNLPTSNTIGWFSNETNTGGNNYFHDFPAQTGTSRHGGRLVLE